MRKVVADLSVWSKIRFPALCYCHFSPNGKAQHIKGFSLNRFAKTAEKDGGFPQPYGEAGACQWWASSQRWYFVITMNINWRLARNVASLTSYWRMNGWQAHSESQPVATVSGESWYFFGHCTEVTGFAGCANNGRDICPFWRNWKMSAGLLRLRSGARKRTKTPTTFFVTVGRRP